MIQTLLAATILAAVTVAVTLIPRVVARATRLGLNSTHMPDDFDRHTTEALAVVDEGRGPHVPADVMRIIDAALPREQAWGKWVQYREAERQ